MAAIEVISMDWAQSASRGIGKPGTGDFRAWVRHCPANTEFGHIEPRCRSDLPGSGPRYRSSSYSSARRLRCQQCSNSHEVVGEHGGADPQLEAVASFGETALHAAASEQH